MMQAALAELAKEEQSRLDRERTATAASERYRRRLRGVPMLAGIMPMSLPPIPRLFRAGGAGARHYRERRGFVVRLVVAVDDGFERE
jgi:hypothetical protein